MSFVHPQLAAATLGLAFVPIIIHLLNKRRYRREPWAAMRFLLAEHERTRRRMRIEQMLLMLARVAVVLLVGLTIARPYFPASATSPDVLRPNHDHVLIMDDSVSMQARRAEEGSSFDRARKAALRFLESARAGDRFAIVTTCSPQGDWFSTPTRDVRAVRRVLNALKCSERRDDLAAALTRTTELLNRGGALEGCRVAHLFSDVARHAVPAEEPGKGGNTLSAIDRLHVYDTGPPDRDNLVVADFQAEGAVFGAGVPIPVKVDVTNFGEAPVSDIGVELLLDDQLVDEAIVPDLKPGATHSLRVDIVLPEAGSHRLSARIRAAGADALGLDDSRRLALLIPRRTSVLFVEGTTRTERTRQSVFFVKSALASMERDDSGQFRTLVVSVADLEAEPLDDHAVVMIAGVSRLSAGAWKRLSEFVDRGGGLILWLDESAQMESFNDGWLAAHFRVNGRAFVLDTFRQVEPPTDPIPLSVGDARHAILHEFAGAEGGGLRSAWIRGHWTLRELEANTDSRTNSCTVLLRAGDGSPILLAGRLGRGAFALGLAGADMTHWNLPAKPDFVPLIWSLTGWCAPDVNSQRTRLVGEAIDERLSGRAAAQSVSIVTPSGGRQELTPRIDGEQVYARFERAIEAGFYSLTVGDEVRHAAVNQDVAESDLRRASVEQVRNLLPGRTVLAEQADAAITQAATWELSTLGMFALVIAVLIETILATSLGSSA